MDNKDWVLVGTSEALGAVKEEVRLAARSDAKVLITGESGVGKEVVARLIHQESRLSHAPLVTLHCAGVPDSLLESELFGHTRGSFTGADSDRPGRLGAGNGGTLFFDEVGEMSLRMQAVLLRLLETGEIQRVGASAPASLINVRVISATNRNLFEHMQSKEFREDLYYRLNVLHVAVPPLRAHRSDILELFNYFLDKHRIRYRVEMPHVSPEAARRLTDYDWPGNVRQLKNVVERLLARSRSDTIELVDLPGELTGRRPPLQILDGGAPPSEEETMLERMLKAKEGFWTVVYAPFMDRDITREQLRWIIRQGLEKTHGNYRILVALFNMAPLEYKRFLSFLRKYGCHIPFQQFRVARSQAEAPAHPLDRRQVNRAG